MAKQLSSLARKIISEDNFLAASICDELGIKLSSLAPALSRNTTSLITYPVLKLISKASGKPIDKLIEEEEKIA